MQLYNTLTKQKQEFKPINPPNVTFYHCGPTVYWTQHIGNLRGMEMGDLIRRSLEYAGFKVNYVRNYTDVGHLTSDADEGEDKMEKGAKRENKTPEKIADKYIKIFEDDIKELNLLEPTHKSKATTCIDEIIDMIQVLLDKEFAYITPKAVYFDVTKAKNYPAFSKRKLEDQREGAGTGDVTDTNKKHPADFALWFFKTGPHRDAMQYWDSPFNSSEVEKGQGFPGWHIECSVIAHKFLGQPIDIHMGGVEHIPIHHPNEIAQSEAAYATKFVNYWLHNEHLLVNDRKMSKSEGTGFSLAEIKEKGFDPLDLRYFFLTAHYRSKQNFTWEALGAAKTARQKLNRTLSNYMDSTNGEKGRISEKVKQEFSQAIEDDVNIPQALAVVWNLINSDESDADKLATILDFDKILGLKLSSQLTDTATTDIEARTEGKLSEEFHKLIEERNKAREEKDFEKSDEIRDQLEKEFNVELEDTSDGTTWKVK